MTPAQLLDACRRTARATNNFDDIFVAQVKALLILEQMELLPAVFAEYEAAIIRTLDTSKVTR